MSYLYAIRIKEYPDYDQKIQCIFSGDRFSRTIRIRHTGKTGKNPHWHLLVECNYSKRDTLATELKKHLTAAKGNTHLSVKVWDGNIRAVAYLFHENTTEDMVRNFDAELVQEAKDINKKEQKKIKANAPVQIVQDCVDYFVEKKIFEPNHKEIFDYIYDRLRDNGDWLPNKFQFERWAMRIQASVRDKDGWRQYKSSLYDLWYGNFTY